MTLRRIAKSEDSSWSHIQKVGFVCTHIEHDPPAHIVLDPGTYEHTCPECGTKKLFTIYQTHNYD